MAPPTTGVRVAPAGVASVPEPSQPNTEKQGDGAVAFGEGSQALRAATLPSPPACRGEADAGRG